MAFKKGFSPELNGLRGCAILLVIFFHANIPYVKGGAIGVDIFYVLSGFLITRLLLQEFDRFGSINFKNFYARRFLRLIPALVVMLAVFCVVGYLVLPARDAAHNLGESLVSLFYMANWSKALGWSPKPVFHGHTWSLSTEEQFYLLWPVLLLVMLRLLKDRRGLLLAAAGLALLSWGLRVFMLTMGFPEDRILYGLDSRGDGLMAGCALAVLFESNLVRREHLPALGRALNLLLPIGAAILLYITAFVRLETPFMILAGLALVDLISVVMILQVFVHPQSLFTRLLGHPWLVYLGTISYGLYLWHFPIFKVLRHLGYDKWILISIGSALSLLIAALSYRFMESPLLRLKERFTRSAGQ